MQMRRTIEKMQQADRIARVRADRDDAADFADRLREATRRLGQACDKSCNQHLPSRDSAWYKRM